MPGPESRTVTRMPFVRLCSLLIDKSRAPLSTAAIASDAFSYQVLNDLLQLNTISLHGS